MEAFSLFVKAEKSLPGWYELEPEVLKETLKLDSLEMEKLYACQTVFHSHSAFTDYHIFDKVCSVFNDEPADFKHIQDHHPTEITWAITQMRMIDKYTPFSEEVLAYIAFHLHKDGLMIVPTEIKTEKDISGKLDIEYFLNDFNKNASPLTEEAKKIQVSMLKKITNYINEKKEVVKKELAGDQ